MRLHRGCNRDRRCVKLWFMGEWVAIDATADRRVHARNLQRAHERMVTGSEPDQKLLRSVVRRSWERSTAAGVDPSAGRAPLLLDEEQVHDRFESHPLTLAIPVL